MKPSVLTIAGSDPSGGAGIQADLRLFTALDLVGLSAITALTVQNSQGVQAVHPVSAEILGSQIESLLSDIAVAAVKIGMLGGAAQVAVVAELLRRFRPPHVVLDPVLLSTSGAPLLDAEGWQALRTELLPLCDVVTPNLREARALAGFSMDEEGQDAVAARRLLAMGAKAVALTGGHARSGPLESRCTDLLFISDAAPIPFAGSWIATPHTHGTGCLHSSAVAAGLAQGLSLPDACAQARALVTEGLRTPVAIGQGRGYPQVYRTSRDPLPQESRTHQERLALLRGLYVLTDPDLRPDRSAEAIVQAALTGGARIVQLRDKYLPTPQLIALAKRLNALARAAGALFLVNDRVDVALASDADGVHLGPDDMLPADARRLLGPERLIGISVSSAEEAIPLASCASYLGVGAIYGSQTKADAGAAVGTARIREIKRAFPNHPLVAIGGIHEGNIREAIEAGADAAAVVSAVVCAPDMRAATQSLLRQAFSGSPTP